MCACVCVCMCVCVYVCVCVFFPWAGPSLKFPFHGSPLYRLVRASILDSVQYSHSGSLWRPPSFHSSLIARWRRSPLRNVCPSQALCPFLMMDIIDFSSSTRRSTSSLVTLFDHETFRIFLQSHISQLSNLRISSLLRAHDSASYSNVLK